MVGRLTVGREGYEDAEEAMRRYLEEADAARAVFLELADRDAQAFDVVMSAFKMPKEDDRQKAERSAAIQRAYEGAARVPLEITEIGNVNAASDGLVAAFALHAATYSALANVEINVAALKDETDARELRGETEALKTRAEALLSETKAAFSARLA
jgi:formiminotetrahydrofolate cyclodeaminase